MQRCIYTFPFLYGPSSSRAGAVLYQAAGPQVAIVNQKSQVELRKVALGRDFGNTIESHEGYRWKRLHRCQPTRLPGERNESLYSAGTPAKRRARRTTMLKCGFGQLRHRLAVPTAISTLCPASFRMHGRAELP